MYSLAKVYVFPSVYEEFGIPILEAMSCGCPVVASNTGAIPELAEGAGILCDPFDDKQFSDGISSILNSKEVEQSYRRKGLEKAKSFSWGKTARETLEILNRFS